MGLYEWLSQVGPGGYTSAGLVSLFVLLFFTGRIYPKSYVDQVRLDAKETIARIDGEKQEWKETATTYAEVIPEIIVQLGTLGEYARTADHLIRSIQRNDTEHVKRVEP